MYINMAQKWECENHKQHRLPDSIWKSNVMIISFSLHLVLEN